MSKSEFIPNKSFLICDKGSVVTQIKVTHNGKVRLNNHQWVTEADIIPNENILPFGSCSVGGACQYEPIYWDKCQETLKINGYKPVIKESCLLCKKGGKITVDFDTPMSLMESLASELGSANHWILGLAIGNEKGISLLEKFKEYSRLAKQLEPNILNSNNAAKETYGENLSKLDFQAKGYEINGSPHSRSFEPGIDVVARDPKADIDILEETKFKSTGKKPYTNSKVTRTGRQGSDKWFKNRLNDRVSPEEAQRIIEKIEDNSPNLRKTITKVEPNGTISRYQLKADGSTGNQIILNSAKVAKSNSRAGNFINSVSQTIQANKAVNASNQWLTRNAHTVSRVGKVVGRGAIVVGITLDAISIYSAYEEEGKVGTKTKQAIGSATGGIAGGFLGAKIGASIGVIAGPVGIAVGGIVGGVIGAIIGSRAGKSIANWF